MQHCFLNLSKKSLYWDLFTPFPSSSYKSRWTGWISPCFCYSSIFCTPQDHHKLRNKDSRRLRKLLISLTWERRKRRIWGRHTVSLKHYEAIQLQCAIRAIGKLQRRHQCQNHSRGSGIRISHYSKAASQCSSCSLAGPLILISSTSEDLKGRAGNSSSLTSFWLSSRMQRKYCSDFSSTISCTRTRQKKWDQ